MGAVCSILSMVSTTSRGGMLGLLVRQLLMRRCTSFRRPARGTWYSMPGRSIANPQGRRSFCSPWKTSPSAGKRRMCCGKETWRSRKPPRKRSCQWRQGLMDVAIGVSGLAPLEDYRGSTDRRGRQLSATIIAVADQLAALLGTLLHRHGHGGHARSSLNRSVIALLHLPEAPSPTTKRRQRNNRPNHEIPLLGVWG
jgi:hypothetical protein